MRAASPYRLRSSWRMFDVAGASVDVPLNAWRITVFVMPGQTSMTLDGIPVPDLFTNLDRLQAGRLVFGGMVDHEERAVYLNQTINFTANGSARVTIQEEWLDTDSEPNT